MPRVKVEAELVVQQVLFCDLANGETFRFLNQDYLKINRNEAFNFNEYAGGNFNGTVLVLPTTARLVVDE
jgi:hypothetical protein